TIAALDQRREAVQEEKLTGNLRENSAVVTIEAAKRPFTTPGVRESFMSLDLGGSAGPLDLFVEEALHVTRDLVSIFFEREVAGVDQMEFEVLQVAFVGLRSFSREDRIVFAPNDQRRRLVLTEVCLPLVVEGRV